MGVITIDYDLMGNLAGQLYDLRNTIDAASKTDHTFTPGDIGPDPNAAQAITDFYGAWRKAFHRAWDVMTTLGNDFNTAANSFFDGDAATAAQINETSLQQDNADYQAQQDAYTQYQQGRNKQVTQTYYDLANHRHHYRAPAQDPSSPAPPAPTRTDQTVTHGADGSVITSRNLYDAAGDVTGVQSTITNPATGYTYSETTNYTANNGYTTTIHYPDGSVTVWTVVAQPDGSAIKTETDGSGTVVASWTGNVTTGQWTQTSGQSGG
jgi:hypothetical protein